MGDHGWRYDVNQVVKMVLEHPCQHLFFGLSLEHACNCSYNSPIHKPKKRRSRYLNRCLSGVILSQKKRLPCFFSNHRTNLWFRGFFLQTLNCLRKVFVFDSLWCKTTCIMHAGGFSGVRFYDGCWLFKKTDIMGAKQLRNNMVITQRLKSSLTPFFFGLQSVNNGC